MIPLSFSEALFQNFQMTILRILFRSTKVKVPESYRALRFQISPKSFIKADPKTFGSLLPPIDFRPLPTNEIDIDRLHRYSGGVDRERA